MHISDTVEKLQSKTEVVSVFITGSQGEDNKPYSDIDIVVILNKNKNQIKSLYTWIDSKFADIFFFDLDDLQRIKNSEQVSANSMDAIFLTWLKKATIKFDKSGEIIKFKENISDFDSKINIPDSEKNNIGKE
ncbi:hypothetical protein GW764_01505 [Candidatus Parcubacteria bacterium]|nr:hypothetical protein [Candidatus Parcubacteria bacterium]